MELEALQHQNWAKRFNPLKIYFKPLRHVYFFIQQKFYFQFQNHNL